MQTVNLDLSVKNVVPLLHAKQGEVGRKFKVILTDGGLPYDISHGAAVSVWFSGASGEGNYTDIGAKSALSVSGNEIIVEMITQMLARPGNGNLCLVINSTDGTQLGTWNIPYACEVQPGLDSPVAETYYSSFSKMMEQINETSQAALEAAGAVASIDVAVHKAEGTMITAEGSGDLPLHSLKLYGKTTQNGTPTPDSPVELVSVGECGSVAVTVCGNNLLDAKNTTNHYYTADGVLTENSGMTLFDSWIPVKKDEELYLSAKYIGTSDEYLRWAFFDQERKFIARQNGDIKSEKCVVTPANDGYIRVFLAKTNYDINTAQLTYGSAGVEFEAFNGGHLTVSTPTGLPGIPVASDGNYTDENGQQWLCDEKDYSRGVYIQRVVKIQPTKFSLTVANAAPYRMAAYYSTKLKARVGLCNIAIHSKTDWGTSVGLATNANGDYGVIYINLPEKFKTDDEINAYIAVTPIVVMAALETPVEKALSEEEIAAWDMLHTNNPNTVVYNDAGAYMQMEYYTPASALPVAGGRMGGDINMVGNTVSGLRLPTHDGDAAPKEYVDRAMMEDKEHPGCYFRTVNGVKEWLSPPMVAGVEYSTTERWEGRRVYTKLVDFGALPNKTYSMLSVGIPAPTVIRMEGWVTDAVGSLKYPLPMSSSEKMHVYMMINGTGQLTLVTMADYSDWTARVTIWYIKPDEEE